jgi:hypothetical protein
VIRALLSLAACFLASSAAFAQFSEVTPLIGYQQGGSVDGATFGLMASFDRGRSRKLDLLASHQSSRDDDSVDYFQIGGRYLFHPEQRVDPYIGATAGGAYISDRIFFSLSLGGGADVTLTRKSAIRFDARFHSTLSSAGIALQCDSSGTCAGNASGSSFNQFTLATGIVFHF